MSEHDREEQPHHPRSVTEEEWEIFIRQQKNDPVQHVGSVTAPTADVAHEQAMQLFDHSARDIWICPADELRRYSVESLADRHEKRNENP